VLVAAFAAALLAGCPLGSALAVLGTTLLVLLAVSVLALLVFYTDLRRQEESDWTDERAPDTAVLREIGRRENFGAQNHMISVTQRKPGSVRWLTLRLAFWFIRMLAEQEFQPGHLGSISSIHAARWVTLPGTRTLVFFSNYGGSWESYLEDFITRANFGLTGVWSNSVGFPKARNLFQDGATDGERFKRYARASMRPTRFWYSAYPDLTTSHIRRNAAIRRGLAVALTNEEAKHWLTLFGSAPLPESKLESREIQSIVFGGLGFMPEGRCLLLQLPDQEDKARAFAAELLPRTAFGDGRRLRRDAVLTVAFGAGALGKLGLPEDCVRTFPPAFLEGMSTPTRSRILGDTAANAPAHWDWGRDPVDVALLVYGKDSDAVDELEEEITKAATAAGMAAPHRISLEPVKRPATEPFGFVDGVSQPVIRGTYQSYRKDQPDHLVEPGEFVIGYPDNHGNLPPEPLLAALNDPANLLPVAEKHRNFAENVVEAPRAVARNGSFLVIRQLEQDVAAFWDYCAEASKEIEARLPEPYRATPDFVAAKLVGRWKDGSSLLRNPYYSATEAAESRRSRQGQPAPAKVEGDNDFLYGIEDPSGSRCPFGAHIRRANPRDSFDAGSAEQIAISNRHRILRVGRLFAPPEGRKPGILFMCLNGDIERQFEFVQQTWLVSPSFHGLSQEQDPLTTSGDYNSKGFLVPTPEGPVRLKPFPHFVKPIGGAYLFLPSRSLLAFLGTPAE
jgi:deferrochelatase/peroxidase EfeB